MTMNFDIKEFKSAPDNFNLSWVSHGDFSITCEYKRINLQDEHFQQILNSFVDAPKPSGRKPFWFGVVPAKGMCLFEYLIEAYACNENTIKLIQSTCNNWSSPNVPDYHCQMVIEIKIIKEMAEIINNYMNKKCLSCSIDMPKTIEIKSPVEIPTIHL